ncbi:MAG: hypothetical protein ACOZDY_13295 [Pseudomonadota bacterium]
MDRIVDLIRAAQGFWIRSPDLLANDSIRAAVETRLREGAIAFQQIRHDHIVGSEWAQGLGIEATSIRAVRADSIALPRYPHPMLVLLRRESFDYGFRDPSLFRGVNELLLQQANGIGCFGDAQVVLAVPSGEIRLLDSQRDLFVSETPRPELPIMATASRSDWRGRVIALHAGILHDAYSGPLGNAFPGITAGDNEVFAKNLIRVLADGPPPTGNTWEDASRLLSEIETGIARLTDRLLRAAAGETWFLSRVPSKIQDDCRDRQSKENAGFPPAAYLDLTHFKTIWKENWAVVSPVFERHSPPASKTKSMKFFQEIIPIRNLSAHPAKRTLADLPHPTREQMDRLLRAKRTVEALVRLSLVGRASA